MNAIPEATTSVAEYLSRHESKSLLRFITCGSVDDGKSTLIGRLLHDSKLLLDDQLASLESDSRRHGTQNGEIDFALRWPAGRAGAGEHHHRCRLPLLLHAAAQVHRRRYARPCSEVHAQYGDGASNCDFGVLLIDARQGVLTQTRRRLHLVAARYQEGRACR